MSMISEQISELRYQADIYNTVGSAWELNRAEAKKLQTMLREAADAIEALSEKQKAANICRNEILKEIREKAQELSNQHWGEDERHLIGKGIQCMCVQAENIIKASANRSVDDFEKESIGKSALIIDTPKKCNDCPMFAINQKTLDVFCIGFCGRRKEIGIYIPSGVKKPDWCPLKESAEDCGGWISCGDRLPTMEECQKNDCRFILDDGNRRYEGLFDYEKKCFTQFDFWRRLVEDKCAIAWQPLPDSYHEP